MNQRLPVVIRGTGCYTPERVITSEHFTEYLDTSDEWITSRTGIHERRWAAPDECTSTHGTHAARRALEDAKMGVDEIDVIICATATGDCPIPATACFIQDQLGATGVPAFDISAACAGFMYGSTVAAGLIQTGQYKNVLVVGAETLSRYADPEDRSMVILFGDAGGAAIWSKTDDPERGILYADMGADGSKVYRTEAFTEDVEVTGPITLVLHASLDDTDGNWIAEIRDVAPDGATRLVTRGWLKASLRATDKSKSTPYRPWHPYNQPTPVVPGEVTQCHLFN